VQNSSGNYPDWFPTSVAALLAHRSPTDSIQISAIPGGGNNRVFRVASGSNEYLVKWYFAAPGDLRDRLKTEWDFATFAWRHGLRSLPEPIACDPERRIAIFKYLQGRRLAAGEVSKGHLVAAIEFLKELNQHRRSADAAHLPAASEACFSIPAHIDCVQERVQRLSEAANDGNVSAVAKDLVNQSLTTIANREIAVLRQQLGANNSASELSQDERIISPSDFGFHNAVLDANDQLRFFDFEYAGWDDPAKTVCDFFSQVAIPVPMDYWPDFVAGVSSIATPSVARRAELLRPLYLIKWCCIVLNPLLKIGRERRQFSVGPERGISESECLSRAEQLLAKLKQ
jgi:hypothetical protein